MLQGGLIFKSKSNMIDLKNNVFHLSCILLQSVDKLNNYFEMVTFYILALKFLREVYLIKI